MLHLFSFLLRAVAIVNVLMFPFVYVVAQFVATTYAIPMGFFMPSSGDPTLFISLFAGYWTIMWIIFACIGVYAFAQFVDLQLAIGHGLLAARRRRQQAQEYQQAQQFRQSQEFQQDQKYQGYDEVPEDGNWASLPERPGSSARQMRPDDEDQRRNVWTSRL